MRKLISFITLYFLTIAAQADSKGTANMMNSTAQSNVVVSGSLNSTHGRFIGDLTIASDHAVLSDSVVKGSIKVKSTNSAVIELRCGTTVSGDVTFEGKAGVVKKTKDSTIHGKVLNGKIIAEESKC